MYHRLENFAIIRIFFQTAKVIKFSDFNFLLPILFTIDWYLSE